jgi:hypothetical protein
MSESLDGPRSDFQSCLDQVVTIKFRSQEYAARLGLGEDCSARLVGYDRNGLWFEPSLARKESLAKGQEVAHYFTQWGEVLTVIRHQDASLFQTKKEYRGLRPV